MKSINQFNSFVLNNATLKAYLSFKENNRLDRKWFDYATGNLADRCIDRKTLRGNFLYAAVRQSICYFLGLQYEGYNYSRDNKRYLVEEIQYTISLDIDGIFISAELPLKSKSEFHSSNYTFVKELAKGTQSFGEDLTDIAKAFHHKYYFPVDTTLRVIQDKFRLHKKEAVEKFKDILKNKTVALDKPSIYDFSIQKSIARKIKRSKNIVCRIDLEPGDFSKVMKGERFKKKHFLERFDLNEYIPEEFDGDIDEVETQFWITIKEKKHANIICI